MEHYWFSNLSPIDFPVLTRLPSTMPSFIKVSKFAQFRLKPELSPLTTILRYLLQPNATTYTSSHPEVFCKIMFSKVSQNSQEKNWAVVSFSCTLIKTSLWNWWFPMNFAKLLWRQNTKGKCVQIFPNIYVLCILKSSNK